MEARFELLYILIEKDFVPVACLTDNPLNESTEVIPTTTRDNNGWESFVAGVQSASISFDGIIPDDPTGKADYYKLREIKRNRNTVVWQIRNNINGDIDEGFGIITSLTKSSPADGELGFSGEIKVTSPIYTTTDDSFFGGFPYVLPNLTP